MIILWDEPKRLATLDERGLDMADLSIEFFEAAVVVPAKGNRYMAIGRFNGKATVVVFRPLGTEAISVISMRRASKKERDLL